MHHNRLISRCVVVKVDATNFVNHVIVRYTNRLYCGMTTTQACDCWTGLYNPTILVIIHVHHVGLLLLWCVVHRHILNVLWRCDGHRCYLALISGKARHRWCINCTYCHRLPRYLTCNQIHLTMQRHLLRHLLWRWIAITRLVTNIAVNCYNHGPNIMRQMNCNCLIVIIIMIKALGILHIN